jgi:hypothetical protein
MLVALPSMERASRRRLDPEVFDLLSRRSKTGTNGRVLQLRAVGAAVATHGCPMQVFQKKEAALLADLSPTASDS